MVNNSKYLLFSIAFVVLSFTVGFAKVDGNFTINNSNNELLQNSVRFVSSGDKAPVIEDSTNATGGFVEVSKDGKSISFGTPTLTKLGQEVTITYYVENNSRDDVELGKLNCYIDDPISDYVTVTPSNNNSGKILVANSTTDNYDSIKIKLVKSYIGDEVSFKISCSMDVPVKNK